MRAALVVVEVALSVVLLAGAGLALRSFVRLSTVDPGFRVGDQLTFTVVMLPARYPSAAQQIAFAGRALDEFATIPPVLHAGATTHLPFSGQNLENSFDVDGYARPSAPPVAGMRGVAGDYFAALGVPLKSGRAFSAADREGTQPVAIVNEAFARRYWPGQNALGKRVREAGADAWRTVIGVVTDVRHSGPAGESRPEVDIPYAQLDPSFMTTWARALTFVVASDLRSSSVTPLVRSRLASVDSTMPMTYVQSISALASAAVSQPRFRTVLLGAFSLVALALATIGVFGVLSYFVTERTREIGILLALGAQPADVLGLVVGRGIRLSGIGIGVGLVAAVALTRLMEGLLFEVTATDPPTFLTVALVLGGAAVLASYIPARRATRIDPAGALRAE